MVNDYLFCDAKIRCVSLGFVPLVRLLPVWGDTC